MAKTEYVIDGFSFPNKAEYERGKKEKETIEYLIANTDSTDMKALLRIYNRSVDKMSFRTVIGLLYMQDLRKRLLGSGVVTEDMLSSIPVSKGNNTESEEMPGQGDAQDREARRSKNLAEAKVKRYKEMYENAKAGAIIKNIAIVIMIIVIFGMIFITYRSQYSVFTYFTNYKENMKEEIADEFEKWQETLEKKEKELEKREAKVQKKEQSQATQDATKETK